ncbi:IclR family transcriptional regulator [Pseudoclavibacter endophyticus]|uniref:Helix-turn-helix domain-containing protein n=1 Tax=Pseudoclavibacter endophyticus TaxID=1778590 RepID=A0A6H9WRT9_9MICO|nr:IclR family transcriptional regulator C-terminal domain-containing protein [Pseudoclavibacter endophyticus]KAB1649657.1 helix-turn-helix domain-containing protein [Pseudoclavibacter endophyticus]GGA60869.1 IclR family transcriptional regulator [Pseudoclavibacter endophyticus]
MAETNGRDRIQSIERGVAVLRAFSGHEISLTVADIASRVGLARPVVRRILITFEHLGYAIVANGAWRLTPKVLEIGSGYFSASSLPEISYGYMSSLADATGATCSVGVLDGFEVIHVARIEAQRPLPDAVRIGQHLPSHATATGHVLLAGQTPEAVDALIREAGDLEAFTPQTIVDGDALRARVDEVRSRGFDVSNEEYLPGQVAAAVPIAVGDEVVGALTLSSTTVRQTERSLTEEAVPRMLESAAGIASAYRNANPHLFRR